MRTERPKADLILTEEERRHLTSLAPRARTAPQPARRAVKALKAAIREYTAASNTAGKPFAWTKTADEILANRARFAQRALQVRGAQ